MRGRNGGVTLARLPEETNVGAVFRLLEGAVPFAECFDAARNTCPIARCCLLRRALRGAIEAFYATLDDVTLADLVNDNAQLEALLSMPGQGGTAAHCPGPAAVPAPVAAPATASATAPAAP